MSDRTFDSEATARECLRARITGRAALTADQLSALTQEWAEALKEPASVPPGASPAMLKRFRWVIRDDDLQLADTLIDCLKTGLTSGGSVLMGSPDAAAWTALAGIASSLFKLGRRAVRKGAVLEPRSFALLLALRADGPLTLPALTFYLSSQDASWNAEDVKAKLKDLGAIALNDGSQQALVAEDADGRWRTAGI